MKNEFSPNIVNAIAFDELQRLLQSESRGLRMELFWRPDTQEWQCEFITTDGYHYMAHKPLIGDAILYAVEFVSVHRRTSVKIEPPDSIQADDRFFFIPDV